MRSQTTIVARYAETDQMGIVHHSVYPIWYEVARTDWIKLLGITYSEMEAMGVMLPLAGLECQYLIPAKYEDVLTVQAYVQKLTPFQIVFGYEVYRDGVLTAKGSTHHGFTDLALKPIPLKRVQPALFERITQYVEK